MKHIQILGTGCPKCNLLHAHAEEAVKVAGVEATITKVEKIVEIMKFGIMATPGLAVDGQVKSAGKVLSVDEIKRMISS